MQTATILARGYFSQNRAKTAHGIIRHGRKYKILNVVDETLKSQDAGDVLGLGKLGIPIVDDIQSGADCLIIGVAPAGGKLPAEWKDDIKTAIKYGMDIVSGLHDFLNDDPELVKLAGAHNVKLWDARAPPPYEELRVAHGEQPVATVVLSYGTDASVGKRTTLLEMYNAALDMGTKAGFVATGQTGILIGCEAGVVVDRLPADFVAGAVEKMVVDVAAQGKELIFVEGQGSLLHQAYSTSAIGILHGALPSHIVITHDPSRVHRGSFPEIKMPELEQELELIRLLSPASKIVGLALNCQRTDDWEGAIEEYQTRTGLLTVDVLKQDDGGSQLVKKISEEINSL